MMWLRLREGRRCAGIDRLAIALQLKEEWRVRRDMMCPLHGLLRWQRDMESVNKWDIKEVGESVLCFVSFLSVCVLL
jgi:hypothetical protein